MINGTVHMAHVVTQSTWVGLNAHGQKTREGAMASPGGGGRPIWSLPAMRCSGKWLGSKPAGQTIGFGAAERRGLTGRAHPWRSGSAAGERLQQARVEVAGMAGTVRQELLGLLKVAAVEPSSDEGPSELAPMRAPVADGADGVGAQGGSLVASHCPMVMTAH
jgi:hypothetical protein